MRATPRNRLLAAGAAMAVLPALSLASAPPALADNDEGATITGGMTHIANRPYPGGAGGSDVEFLRQNGRDYALAGSLRGGLQIVDITDPTQPVLTTYDCPLSQGDVQIFRQGDRPLMTYTMDGSLGAAGAASACGSALKLASSYQGTIILDLTNPTTPVPVSAIDIPAGSHNMSVHPSGNYLYNSNSALATDTSPQIEIFDITDPANPTKVREFFFPFQPGLGSNSHDIDFNDAGTRGYSAALSSTLVLNTEDPSNPSLIAQVVNERINVEHDVKWVPMTKPDGTTRELLLVGDEQGGAAATAGCPGGGITVYDITGSLESNPRDLGTWYIPDTGVPGGTTADAGAGVGGAATVCTSHVFQVYPEQGLLTIAWYEAGVRVLDISGLATYTAPGGVPTASVNGNGIGMRQIGSYFFPNSDTWSFKTNRINTDGSFFGYGDDISRGFDVYFFPGFADGRTVPAFGSGNDGPDPVVPEAPVAVLLPLSVLVLLAGTWAVRRRGAAVTG